MAAGDSARARGVQLQLEADEYIALARVKRKESSNYLKAAASEAGLAPTLRALNAFGWRLLEDRLWPGSTRANVDFILVGPGGVVVVDAKSWAEAQVVHDRVFRGQADVTEELDTSLSLADRIAEGVEETGLTTTSITTIWSFDEADVRAEVRGIHLVTVCDLVPAILALPKRLTESKITDVAVALDRYCPRIRIKQPTLQFTSRPALRKSPAADALPGVDDVTTALLEHELAAPIEEWMTYLHPDQVRLTRTTWNGAARVRGPAGTGKTVVGLHRAAHLALRSPHPVLFTSFVRTLPPVFAKLIERFSPAACRNIEFIGVHKLAGECLEKAGRRLTIDVKRAENAYARAWAHSPLRRSTSILNTSPIYWKEEIDYVIKGRGLKEFEAYRDLARVGRKTPLRGADRELMWDLYLAYERNLRDANTHDFNDLILAAHDVVLRMPSLFRYSAVIVDEVQDLPLIAVRFLDALSGEGPNRLLILGDSRQSVYPGGFTLAEAGISVTGRAHVLRINYRNTAEILDVAAANVSGESVIDLDGSVDERIEGEVSRRGARPVVSSHPDASQSVAACVAAVQEAQRAGTPFGNMAILLQARRDLDLALSYLRGAGVPAVRLTDYEGVTSEHVKVGTVKRAKGLEFSRVFLPAVQRNLRLRPDESATSYAERLSLHRREHYVAMTRARDHLWVSYLPDVADVLPGPSGLQTA